MSLREIKHNLSCVFCALLVLFVFLNPVSAQQRPLVTEDPRLISSGSMVVETGISYLDRVRFPVSGLGGNEFELLNSGFHFGLGDRAEFQVTGVFQNVLLVHENGSGRRSDWGDFALSTKMRLAEEGKFRPIVSFRPTVVLPNSNNEKGIGTNTTKVFGTLLFGKSAGRAFVFANAGLGILDDPVHAAAQQDVFTYGMAVMLPLGRSTRLVYEWNGLQNPRDRPGLGAENRRQMRLGAQLVLGGLRWDMAGVAGLTRLDPRAGVVLGVTKEFRLWK